MTYVLPPCEAHENRRHQLKFQARLLSTMNTFRTHEYQYDYWWRCACGRTFYAPVLMYWNPLAIPAILKINDEQ